MVWNVYSMTALWKCLCISVTERKTTHGEMKYDNGNLLYYKDK